MFDRAGVVNLFGGHMGATIYPELVGFMYRGNPIPPVAFPPKCPVCDSPLVQLEELSCTYTCGGGYSPKPQIQNHTDIWWGQCRLVK